MHVDPPSAQTLTRAEILSALEALSDGLRKAGITGEICLFGGTVMVLAFASRVSTKDVDALFKPAQIIRELSTAVATDHKLPESWINDGVKGFVSARHETTEGNLPQFPNLRLTMPVPEYLLAMKCMAARVGGVSGESSDIPDIRFLMKQLQLTSAEEVLEIVAQYYPEKQITVRTQYLIESLLGEDPK